MRSWKPRLAAASFTVLAANFAFFPSARAATEMRTGGPPAEYVDYLKMKPMQAMHMMEGSENGSVTKEEFLKFHEDLFIRMDKDGDGKVSATEWLGRPPRKDER